MSHESVVAELEAVVAEINACQKEIIERTEDWAAQQWSVILTEARREFVEDTTSPEGKKKGTWIDLPKEEADRRVAALEADGPDELYKPRPYNDDKMRKLVEAKATALHALALLTEPDEDETKFYHRIVYESGLDATCACGAVLTIYGRSVGMASVFAEHIKLANAPKKPAGFGADPATCRHERCLGRCLDCGRDDIQGLR